MEWIEEEFELLAESDFYNTEWKIGTIMENKPREASSIDTTWVRLVTTENGDNKAIWGDNSQGKWTIDVPSQFFSISKETFGGWFGKQIWAGTVDDFYYLDGTVRGWSPISPASVEGQWQGVRLGVVEGDRVSAEERGEAPWFTAAESEDEVGLAEKEEVGEDAEEEAAIESEAEDENVEEEAAIESEAEEEEVGEDAEETSDAVESEAEVEEVGELRQVVVMSLTKLDDFTRDLLSFILIDQTQDVLTLQWNYEWCGFAKSSTEMRKPREILLDTEF